METLICPLTRRASDPKPQKGLPCLREKCAWWSVYYLKSEAEEVNECCVMALGKLYDMAS